MASVAGTAIERGTERDAERYRGSLPHLIEVASRSVSVRFAPSRSEAARGLASLQRFFRVMTKTTITASAFQKRISPKAAVFLQGVLDQLLASAARGASAPACARLARFREVFAIDGSLVPLHKRLQEHFRGFRSEGTEAMAKLHVVHNLSRRDIERLRISGGRVPDIRGAAFGQWVKGARSLFDVGY